jgi:hypothetical protein
VPGYLTHAMILIKAEQWLGELAAALERRRTAQASCLSETEEALLALARQSQSLLRVDPAAPQGLPATRIENGVGTGLSRYAFAGAIGMDFPITGYVLALNHEWVAHTLHRGAPRRAWVKAGSTEFVLNLIKTRADSTLALTPQQQRAVLSYALGHIAGVAADVVLGPAINTLAWSDANSARLDQRRFEVQLDARVAHGFFQRDDLHDGQSWEDYFLDSGTFKHADTKLVPVYVQAFKDTYGGDEPNEPLCAAAQCRHPKLDDKFLIDGYANTKNWAIGVGYDQSPWWWYKLLLGTAIAAGGVVTIALAWSATSTYNLTEWQQGNGWGTERLWFDMIDNALTCAGVIYLPFTWLAKFPIGWDGIFGQGTIGATERPAGHAFLSIFKGAYDLLSFLLSATVTIVGWADSTSGFYTSVNGFLQRVEWRWPKFAFSSVLELLKVFLVDMGSVEQGREGDKIGFTLFWPTKVSTFGTFLVSALIVFGAKSARDNPDGTTESTASGWDFLIGLAAPTVLIAITWGTGYFEKYVLEHIAGGRWPDTDTNLVNDFTPVETANNRRTFTDTGAQVFGVSLLAADNEGVVTQDGKERFAESESASPYATVRQRDDAARKAKRQFSSKTDWTLNQLFERAAQLAGVLAMSAVNYDAVGARMRDNVKDVFKDWNLDYRTTGEWDALMRQSTTDDMGLLEAVGRWWDDLKQNRPATDAPVLGRIGHELPVTGLGGTLEADFTHTNPAADALDGRCKRQRRPGVIVLPNLALDEPITLPLPPPPLPDRRPLRDAVRDNTINANADEAEMTLLRVRRATRPGVPAYDLELRVHAGDAPRIRVFEMNAGTPDTWARRMGADSGGAATPTYAITTAGDTVDFRVEALTLAGDPSLRAPAAPAPLGRDGVTPVAPSRLSGDVWVELVHRDGGAELPALRDTALMTIAPYLLFSNLQPFERMFVVYLRDVTDPNGILHANHSTIADLVEAMTAALGAARVPVRTNAVSPDVIEFVPHRPVPDGTADAAQGLYIIDGSGYSAPNPWDDDVWIQDEIEIGYCWKAPNAWTHMTVHVPRKRGLAEFVHREIPAARMGLFDGFDHMWDSINYGGNIEVSPPVDDTTTAQAEGNAGLAIADQPRAPFGKVLLGEGLVFLANLDTGIAGDLDLGGLPNAAVVTEFRDKGVDLAITTITVTTAGSEWEITITVAGGSITIRLRLEVGRLNLYEPRPFGADVLLGGLDPAVSASLVPDLDAGGHPSERIQEAFNAIGGNLPVPDIVVRTPGNEWLVVLAGQLGRPMLLVRREGAHLRLSVARIAEPSFHRFLTVQGVQPILSFDTAWLHVGHVDEVMIFVPANDRNGYRLLMSSTELATNIFRAADALASPARPLTDLFRGKKTLLRAAPPSTVVTEVSATISVAALLASDQASNDELQTERLTPIETRLRHCCRLVAADIIHIPVYFDAMPLGSIGRGGLTSARTPHMVNLQVVDRHVMVPRPYGPRMRVADAVSVLNTVGLAAANAGRLTPLVGHWNWSRAGELATDLESTFGVAAAAIRGHARNSGKFTGAGAVRRNWDRIWIPEDNVDLLEAYVQIVLEDIGLTVHWIDDWDTYHRRSGEIHCGTNVVRTPPEAATGYGGPFWWDHYRPS